MNHQPASSPQTTTPPDKPISIPLITRPTYLIAGLIILGLKFLLDYTVSHVFFDKYWSYSYFLEPSRYYHFWSEFADRKPLLLSLITLSLPFIVLGLWLTLGRLKDARLHPAWAAFLFVPQLNLIFFYILMLFPSQPRPTAPIDPNPNPGPPAPDPLHIRTAEVYGAIIASLFGLAMVTLATLVYHNYGWLLFVAVPVVQGFIASTICLALVGKNFRNANRAALYSGGIIATGILAIQLEGIICLAMAAPLAIPLLILGACVGYLMLPGRQATTFTAIAVWVITPAMLGIEQKLTPPPNIHPVTTSIVVNAPPETVWENVIQFPGLPPPTEPIFKTGIAYPTRATIHGSGVGAIRYCEFSTGPFVEPITIWDPPHKLAFEVTSQPPPMQELTIFSNTIHPPHLEDLLFISHRGQFILTPLPDGTTKMEGTTWYHNGMWPQPYWKLWSDWVIHKIHLRVLNHIKIQSEPT